MPQLGKGCYDRSNLLQPISDALASDNQLDFVAMSQFLNDEAKSSFFPSFPNQLNAFWVTEDLQLRADTLAAWKWQKGDDSTRRSVSTAPSRLALAFEKMLYGVLEMNSDDVFSSMDRTNNRIYARL